VNNFTLEIWDDESALCTFYTIRKQGAQVSETDKFFSKHDNLQEYKEPTTMLLNHLLKTIGEDHGAREVFFNRDENEVKGLPFHGKLKLGNFELYFPQFPLRLYAIRLRDNLVILFNGGIKDGANNQTSSLHMEWIEACQFAQKIDAALISKELTIDELSWELVDTDGNTNHIKL
jgi:hypothetical protein